MRTVKAGVRYFILVFGTGFGLGMIRTLWVVPRLGVRYAELLESPLILLAIVLAARSVNRRLGGGSGAAPRWLTGGLALALLLAAEIATGMIVGHRTFSEVFTDHDPVSGTVYYALVLLFAIMPGLVWRGTARPAHSDP